MTMREINLIVVHCSASDDGQDIGRDEIKAMHLARGFADVGYHYIIRRNGVIEIGRLEEVMGAHAEGYNAASLGVCLVGGVEADDKLRAEFNFTRSQMRALEGLLIDLTKRFPKAEIRGHKDLPNVAKACPCFDVRAWWNETGAKFSV